MSNNKYLIKGAFASEKYKEYLESKGAKGKGLLNHSAIRHDRFIRESMPILSENIDLANRNVIEFGFGHGSATHAISHFANHVYAFDINDNLLKNSAKRTEFFNLQNITFNVSPSESLIDDALKVADDKTVFILHAVLEHMTEEERYTTLTNLWDAMGDDNFLYIGNTPNKLSWLDIHTHDGVPFLFSLPDYTCSKYLAMHPEIRFSKEFINIHETEGLDAFSLNRKRRGMGVSFHDFEIAFAGHNLNECIIVNGIHQPFQFNSIQ